MAALEILGQDDYDFALRGVYKTIDCLKQSTPPPDIATLETRAREIGDDLAVFRQKLDRVGAEARKVHNSMSSIKIDQKIAQLKDSLGDAKTPVPPQEGPGECIQMEAVALRAASLAIDTMEVNAELMKAVLSDSMLIRQLRDRLTKLEHRIVVLIPVFVMLNVLSVAVGFYHSQALQSSIREMQATQQRQEAIIGSLTLLVGRMK